MPCQLKNRLFVAGSLELSTQVRCSKLVSGPWYLLSCTGDRLNAAAPSKDGGRAKAMVVGLGGGGLPAYLALRCQLAVTVVELDSTVHEMALRWFALPTKHLQVQYSTERRP